MFVTQKSLLPVLLSPLHVDAYRGIVDDTVIDQLVDLARPLTGLRVAQINATPTGGGVAEMMVTQAPLANALGVQTDWLVISGDERFFDITKAIHNGLQGHDVTLTDDQKRHFRAFQKRHAADLIDSNPYDVVIVHDPQPVGIAHEVMLANPDDETIWVWRCHVDSSTPAPDVWRLLRHPYLDAYDVLVFTMADFAPDDLDGKQIELIPPAIDPLRIKNQPMVPRVAREIVADLGIDPDRPLMAQVARLDPHKDPWGVIDAYRIVKSVDPDVQLVLLGVIAAVDDPEAVHIYSSVVEYAAGDPDIHIHVDPLVIGELQVNAVQTHASVIFNKSLKEGFALSVTEALWKGRPVIGGRVGGIPLQIADGIGGFLVSTVEEAAHQAIHLLTNPEVATRVGLAGIEHVRNHFLMPRLVADELRLIHRLLAARRLVR